MASCDDVARKKSSKSGKSSERRCFVCKRSILLYKYINLSTIRKSEADSQKKDIIRILQIILNCNDEESREWKYICDPCRNTANEIYKYCEKGNAEISDDVAAITDDFVTRYKANQVLRAPSEKRNRKLTSTPSPAEKTRKSSSSVQQPRISPVVSTPSPVKSTTKSSSSVQQPRSSPVVSTPSPVERTRKSYSSVQQPRRSPVVSTPSPVERARKSSSSFKQPRSSPVGTSKHTLKPRSLQVNKGGSIKRSPGGVKNQGSTLKDSGEKKTPSELQSQRRNDGNITKSKHGTQKEHSTHGSTGQRDKAPKQTISVKIPENVESHSAPSEQTHTNEDLEPSKDDSQLQNTADLCSDNTCQMQPLHPNGEELSTAVSEEGRSTDENILASSHHIQDDAQVKDPADSSQMQPREDSEDAEAESVPVQQTNAKAVILLSSEDDTQPQNTADTSAEPEMEQFENIDVVPDAEACSALPQMRSTNEFECDIASSFQTDTQTQINFELNGLKNMTEMYPAVEMEETEDSEESISKKNRSQDEDTKMEFSVIKTSDLEDTSHLQPFVEVQNSQDLDAPLAFVQQTYNNEDILTSALDGTRVQYSFAHFDLENAPRIQPIVKDKESEDVEVNTPALSHDHEQTNTNEDVLASFRSDTELENTISPLHLERSLQVISQKERYDEDENCQDDHEEVVAAFSEQKCADEDTFAYFKDIPEVKNIAEPEDQEVDQAKTNELQNLEVEEQLKRSTPITNQYHHTSTSVSSQDDIKMLHVVNTSEENNNYQMQPLVKVEGADSMTLDEIKELQLVMNIKEAAFREESRAKKGKVSDSQMQALIGQHKKQKEECDRLRNLEKIRMKEKLKEKLAARRRSRQSTPIITTEISSEAKQQEDGSARAQQFTTIPECTKSRTEKEQIKKRLLPSKEETQQVKDSHERELNELQQKLGIQKKRQGQDLLDKLAARRMRRGEKDESKSLSSEEVDELQSAIDQKSVDFRKEMEEARKTQSSKEVQVLLDAHLNEVDSMQQQLDNEKERMRAALMAKLKARRQRQNIQITENEPDMSEEDIKQLQLVIDKKDSVFKEELRSKKGVVSDKQYQQIIDRHNREMEDLKEMLDTEKIRMEQKLKDKLTARKKKPTPDVAQKNEIDLQVEALEREIENKIAALSQEAHELRPLLSDDEYDQLLAQHRKELQSLKNRLNDAMKRQKQTLMNERLTKDNSEDRECALLHRFIHPEQFQDNEIEPLTEEEFDVLEEDINHYDSAAMTQIMSQQDKVSEAKYEKLIREHQRKMKMCNSKLERHRQQIWTDMRLSNSVESKDEDIHDPVAIPVSTQLWTTPAQHSVLSTVPLTEAYPIRTRNQLYTDAAIFKHLDAHAIQMAQHGILVTQPSFSALLNELIRIGTTELEKVRLIFRWITAQNCDYMDIADAIDDTPLGVLKGLYHSKITFATLFMRMCRFVGLQCVEISGCAKLKGYQPGQFVTLDDGNYAHKWNAVRIDGYWHFVDCNWGVSYIKGSVSLDPFRFEYDEHYFLADPVVMIKTHFPNNESWQLLRQPLTLKQFNETVVFKPDFFRFGFELLSHQKPVIDTYNGDLDIQIGCPFGFILYCNISNVIDDKQISSQGTRFSQYVSIHQVAEKVMACHIRFPEPGHYYTTFYTKQQYVDGEINSDSQTEICKYYVRCYASNRDAEPLPISPADHWGPLGVVNAGLTPITHKDAVIKCQDGSDIDIRFKKTHPDLKFTHDMTGNGFNEKQLAPYSLQRDVDDEMVFTLCLPQAGRYGLHIYTIYPENIHLCSYLIEMSIASKSVQSIPPPPAGEEYGPTSAFHDLGITSFTHPDPFIRTSDRDLQIVFGLSATKLTLNQTLTYNYSDGRSRDLSSKVKCEFETGSEGSSISYYLYLKKPGFYHFRLEGNERDLPSDISKILLYNYVIRMN